MIFITLFTTLRLMMILELLSILDDTSSFMLPSLIVNTSLLNRFSLMPALPSYFVYLLLEPSG